MLARTSIILWHVNTKTIRRKYFHSSLATACEDRIEACIYTFLMLYSCYIFVLYILCFHYATNRQDGVDGIATRYGLEGPGIESRWGEIFRTYPHRLRGPPNLLYNGYRVFPGGKGGRGVMLTTHPLIVPRLRKRWAITPLTLWVLLDLLRGSLYLLYFMFSLRYKPAGRGFDSQLCHWNFSVT
jgi:hypothetical protein